MDYKILDFYKEQGFDLVPILANSKIPIELGWVTKEHKDPIEWKRWIDNGLNLGVKCGKSSNIVIIDIDQKPTPPELQIILDKYPTLIQHTSKGIHYFYRYTDKLPKTRIDELKIDIETVGGQCVIYPSIVDGFQRELIIDDIAEFPEELLTYLQSKITIPTLKTNSEQLVEDINTEDFNLGVIEEGNRNGTLCFIAGTPVRTPDGKRSIQHLKKGDEIFSYDFDTNQIKISNVINTIKIKSFTKVLLKIEPYKRMGVTKISCTPEQLFYTNKGWIKAKDLEINEEIFTINNKTDSLLKENFNLIGLLAYKIGYIYGYIEGDGCIRKDNMIDISSKDLDGLNRIKNYLYQIYNVNLITSEKIGEKNKYYRILLYSHLAIKLLEKAKKFEIIKTKDFKRGYIAGIFDAEGTNEIFHLSISNTNYNIIEKVKNYLIDFGFDPKIGKDERLNRKICFGVHIGKLSNIVKFFYLMRPAILRKYPWNYFSKYGIKNGRKVISKETKITKSKRFTFYDIETYPHHNFFAHGLLVHNCHLGGLLRKEMNINQTEYVLNIVNKHFCKPPLLMREVDTIVGSLEKYCKFDETDLALKILNWLKIVEEASSRDIKEGLGETSTSAKQRVDKALKYLMKEGFVFKKRREFHLIKKAEWKTSLLDTGKIINFEMPYFHNHAIFRDGDMLVIGAKTGYGKTHVSMNIVKQLSQQGIIPHYISLESGARFIDVALKLGMKDGDFKWSIHFSPQDIELEENTVTIIDWLLPDDYATTDKLYKYFAEQLVKKGGILIVFVQLMQNGSFFAANMIDMFPAFVAKFLYEDETGTNSYFQITKIREQKEKIKYNKILTSYDWQSRELKVRDV